ncbi:MAG: ornithine cyclodeaminase family protein [Candidatus Hodarchaeales archaeon]|jgi:ornithine cyclodeaminase/alanine dehydrogenase
MSSDSFLYLSRKDVEDVNLSMQEIIDALEFMFREKGEGKVEMPPKPGIHTQPDAFIHAMPAYIPALKSAGLKWVSGYPENWKRGLPYITGLLILNDPEIGIPISVMDCTWITAKRTGAATAVAAKYLARSNSSNIGIIACGVQGRSNLEALSCLFQFEKIKAYDISKKAAIKFSEEMSVKFQIPVETVSNPADAVRDIDIVITSGPILKNPNPTIKSGWLSTGSFACPVDFDSYWQGDALKEVDKLITDDLNQLEYYRKSGYFQHTPEPYADLGEIVTGKKFGREFEDERIICINLGLALDDMATAPLIYKKAKEKGIGQELPL